jgi:hypothetical protein
VRWVSKTPTETAFEDSEGHTVDINIITNASNSQRVETAISSEQACEMSA